jgi:hypothetical protein
MTRALKMGDLLAFVPQFWPVVLSFTLEARRPPFVAGFLPALQLPHSLKTPEHVLLATNSTESKSATQGSYR